eukprot:COSAG02_NODE_59582_length_274_cov_0.554286_1_plen_46_part_10
MVEGGASAEVCVSVGALRLHGALASSSGALESTVASLRTEQSATSA